MLMLRPDLVKDMELTVKQVQHNLKVSQDRKKKLCRLQNNSTRVPGRRKCLCKGKTKKNLLKVGKILKLAPKYCGPFEILEKNGPMAYQLALPPAIKVHNVFHVSILKKYIHDDIDVIDWNVIQVEPEGEFQVEQERVLNKRELLL